ncbi:MAG: hypothetical protein ABJE95_20115 [Byssovorax sp.]
MERRRWPRIPASLVAAIGLCFPGAAALAEPRSEADHLFARGLQAMEAGDFPAACPALSESYRLDPLLGTLFTLAECERLARRSATALGHYEAFLAKVKALSPAERHRHKDREKVALQQRDVMSVVAPRLVLKLPLAAADTRLRARVDLDGLEVPLASLGTSMRVDPGGHNVSVTTPDGVERSAVSVVEREEKIIELALPKALARVGAPVPQPRSAGAPVAAYIAGGVGAAGLVVGAVTGILAITKKSEVDAGCDANKRCSPAGKAAADALQSRALVSNIGFAVGAVGVGAAIVLLLTRSKDPPPRVEAARLVPLLSVTGPHEAWIGIERSF